MVQRFQELFSHMKYKEAADLLADSPQGISADTRHRCQIPECPCGAKTDLTSAAVFEDSIDKEEVKWFWVFGAFPLCYGPEQEEPAGDQNS